MKMITVMSFVNLWAYYLNKHSYMKVLQMNNNWIILMKKVVKKKITECNSDQG